MRSISQYWLIIKLYHIRVPYTERIHSAWPFESKYATVCCVIMDFNNGLLPIERQAIIEKYLLIINHHLMISDGNVSNVQYFDSLWSCRLPFLCHTVWNLKRVNTLRSMAAIFQTTFSNAFSWMKMHEFRLRFHWSLFPRVQFITFQHWFR